MASGLYAQPVITEVLICAAHGRHVFSRPGEPGVLYHTGSAVVCDSGRFTRRTDEPVSRVVAVAEAAARNDTAPRYGAEGDGRLWHGLISATTARS